MKLHRRDKRNLFLVALLAVVAFLPPLLALPLGHWPFFDDGLTMFNVWRGIGRENLERGQLPLWNPYIFCGLPVMANNQPAILYPPNIIYLALPMPVALLFDAILHNVWLACGGYFLGRVLGLSRTASVLGAMVWSLGGAVPAHLYNGHLTWNAARAWLPWELLFLTRYLRFGDRRSVVLLAVAFTAQAASGYMPITILSIALTTGLFCAFAVTKKLPQGWFPAAALCAILTAGLSAVYVLPLAEVSELSVHGNALNYASATDFSGTWRTLVRLLLPNFFGGNTGVQWSIRWLPHEEVGYIGLLPLLLVLGAPWFALRHGKLHRAAPFLLLLIPVALLMSMGRNLPVYKFAFDYLPIIHKTRVPVRWVEIFYYAGALLCGFSFDSLIHRRTAGPRAEAIFQALLAVTAAACLALLVFLASQAPDSNFWMRTVQAKITPLPVTLSDRIGNANELWNAAVLETLLGAAFAGFGAYLFFKWRKAPTNAMRRGAARLILVIIAIDLVGLDWRSARTISSQQFHSIIEWPRDLVARFRKEQRWETALNFGTINHAALNHIPVVNGYDALGLKRYFNFASAAEGRSMWVALYEIQHRSPLLRVAGLTNTIVSQQDFTPAVRNDSPEFVPRRIAESGRFQLWQWEGAWPRAYVTRNLLTAKDDEQLPLLEDLAKRDFKAQGRPAVVAPGDFAGILASPLTDADQVTDWNFGWNHATLRTTASAPSLLVFNDTLMPGWRAFVNGQTAEMTYANYLFRGVPVPAGPATVEMLYEPQTYRATLFISLCALSALTMLCLQRRSLATTG